MNKDRIALIALFIVCFFWGTTYLAIRIGVQTFPPFLFTGIRMFISGLLMGIIWFFQKKSTQLTWKMILTNSIAGFFFFSFGVGMVGWAEQLVPSGLAAMICSFPPVWIVLLNVFVFRVEKLNGLIIIGILLGLGGMILVFHEHLSELLDPKYRFAIGVTALANFGWAMASVFIKKRNPSTDSVLNACIQMLAGGLLLLLFYGLFESKITIVWSPPVIYSMAYLIIFGSVLTFWAYLYALKSLPITLVSVHNYVNVLVAILLGYLILNEKLNPFIFISVLITLLGIYLVHRGLKKNIA